MKTGPPLAARIAREARDSALYPEARTQTGRSASRTSRLRPWRDGLSVRQACRSRRSASARGGSAAPRWLGADDRRIPARTGTRDRARVDFIDTALGYGAATANSSSAARSALRPSSVVVATKIPPKNGSLAARRRGPRPTRRSPRHWIVECTERSLRNLGLETDRRAAVPRLVRRLGRARRLARGRRAAEARREDPLLRRLDQRPRAGERRSELVEIGPRRHGAGRSTTSSTRARGRPPPGGRRRAASGVIVRVPFDEGSLDRGVRPDTAFPR